MFPIIKSAISYLNPRKHINMHRNEYGRVTVAIGIHLPGLRWTGITFHDRNWYKQIHVYPPISSFFWGADFIDGKISVGGHGTRFVKEMICH